MLLRYYTIFREEIQHSFVDFMSKNVTLLEKNHRFQTPLLCRVTNTMQFILLRQEDSDLYRSGMNCRQPVGVTVP